MSIEKLKKKIVQFRNDRDWERFHSPKNLVMALTAEVGELVEPFMWLTESQSLTLDASVKIHVEEEMADVLILLLNIADRLDVDLLKVSHQKLKKNALKYPVALSRGRATKPVLSNQEAKSKRPSRSAK